MAKSWHEFRDAIHVFIRVHSDERKVIDSRQFQRLRDIHQLAMSYLVYPGATHRRFEHSLGVMDLAGRVFDVVTQRRNLSGLANDIVPDDAHKLEYWRRVVRMAALCHDIGHLPFSHASEELLPTGASHENLTWDIVTSDEMKRIWDDMKIQPKDIAKLAVGPRKSAKIDNSVTFDAWEGLLSEIIVGDAFGVDRMDYLLRDSYHTGVAYGRFDHNRLIDSLRILPPAPSGDNSNGSKEPVLGVDVGGLQSAEALLMARYFMYSQVYMHPVRRIYDIHLVDFLKEWLPNGKFSMSLTDHAQNTDSVINAAIQTSYYDTSCKQHLSAKRLHDRQHFKVLYSAVPRDIERDRSIGQSFFEAAKKEFSIEPFRHDRYVQKGNSFEFPVLQHDDSIASSISLSDVLRNIPLVSTDIVFVDREIQEKAKTWKKSWLDSHFATL
jgi:uncharacterized protein